MDDEKNERYLTALENRNKIEYAKVQAGKARTGWAVVLILAATPVWGLPLSVALWRAAFGN